MPLIFTIRAGKQNLDGQLETIRALQHKKPLICVFNWLACCLLSCWDLGNEASLDFRKQSAWYKIFLIKKALRIARQRSHITHRRKFILGKVLVSIWQS